MGGGSALTVSEGAGEGGGACSAKERVSRF